MIRFMKFPPEEIGDVQLSELATYDMATAIRQYEDSSATDSFQSVVESAFNSYGLTIGDLIITNMRVCENREDLAFEMAKAAFHGGLNNIPWKLEDMFLDGVEEVIPMALDAQTVRQLQF